MTDINDLTVEQYRMWKAEGLTDRNILVKMYYSPDNSYTLRNWKRKHGILKEKHKHGSRFDLTIHEFAKYKSMGIRNKEIAKKYNVCNGVVNNWLREKKRKGILPSRKLVGMDWVYIYEQLRG